MRSRGARPCRDTRTTGARSFPARVVFRARVNELRQSCEVDEDDESFATFYLPPVIRGMAGLNCDEGAATSGADFIVRDQLAFDDRLLISRLNHTRDEFHWPIARRRT